MFGTWKIVLIGWWTKSSNLYMGNGWKSPFPSTFDWLFGVPGWYVFLFFCWSMVSSNKNLRFCTLTSWSKQCVSLRLTLICCLFLNLGKQNRIKTKKKNSACSPQKKTCRQSGSFLLFFLSKDPSPSFSACPFFFFWRCQRLMWWVTWRRTWRPEASFVTTRIPRFCQTGGGVKQKRHDASMQRWVSLLVVIHGSYNI